MRVRRQFLALYDNIFKNDYLENNLSIDELSSKYNLSNKKVLKKLFKYDILKESDKTIYEETIANKKDKLDNMYNDIQVLKNDIEQIKNDMKEFKNTFNKLIGILTKK